VKAWYVTALLEEEEQTENGARGTATSQHCSEFQAYLAWICRPLSMTVFQRPCVLAKTSIHGFQRIFLHNIERYRSFAKSSGYSALLLQALRRNYAAFFPLSDPTLGTCMPGAAARATCSRVTVAFTETTLSREIAPVLAGTARTKRPIALLRAE
jgi:hypothetical protein